MFKDLPEGQTHSFNDGCGEPAHNKPSPPPLVAEGALQIGKAVVDEEGESECGCMGVQGSCMDLGNEEVEEWEVEFDKKFILNKHLVRRDNQDISVDGQFIKDFIRTQLSQARTEERAAVKKEIDNVLDEIEGVASQRYFPAMDETERLEHIKIFIQSL